MNFWNGRKYPVTFDNSSTFRSASQGSRTIGPCSGGGGDGSGGGDDGGDGEDGDDDGDAEDGDDDGEELSAFEL